MSQAIAREFSRLLTQYLGKGTMRQLIRKNKTAEYKGFCASHDYCDSNVFMIEAICNHLGLDPDSIDLSEYSEVMNQSWDMAKDNGFFQL